MFKKSLLAGLVTFSFVLSPLFASAETASNLQAQIDAILVQIKQLQIQLNAQNGVSNTSTTNSEATYPSAQSTTGTASVSGAFCHAWNRNLRIGDRGTDVEQLVIALKNGGFLDGKASGFDEKVASALVEFQEQYASEILTPNKLRRGTGFAGASTRAVLNRLYKCGNQTQTNQPYITSVAGMAAGNFEIDAGGKVGIQGTNLLGYKDSTNVYIGGQVCTITQLGDALIYCTAPSTLQVGNVYDLYINTVGMGGDKVTSNIVKVKVLSNASQPSVTILSPITGNSYKHGDNLVISWIYSGFMPKDMRVYLYDPVNGSREIGTLLETSARDTVMQYIIPSSLSPRNDYSVQVCDQGTSNPSIPFKPLCSALSGKFTITATSIQPPPLGFPLTVVSPNGGENWQKNSLQNITWKDSSTTCPPGAMCPQVLKNYEINLVPYYPPCTTSPCPMYALPYHAPYLIARGVSDYNYAWTVGKILDPVAIISIVPDGAYTIQVCQVGTTICDSSDSYFKITQSSTVGMCTDSDQGRNYYTKGVLTVSGSSGSVADKCQIKTGDNSYVSTDSCSGSTCYLEEAWCEAPSKSFQTFPSEFVPAPLGCSNGVMTNTTQSITAFSSEIIGGQSTYTPGQTIKFSVRGMASNGTVGGPAMGFNVQASMKASDPVYRFVPVQVNGVYQSFNANYNPNTALWDVIMTAPSDTTKTYTIDSQFYCSNSTFGCSSGQIDKSFTFSLSGTLQPSITVLSPNGGEVWQSAPQVTDTISGNEIYRKDITWSGVSDSPEINSGTPGVRAYLEKLMNGQYVTVGRIPPFAYGSIAWVVGVVGKVDCDLIYPSSLVNNCFNKANMQVVSPGQYYVRLVDARTGVSDRSNSPFTITAPTTQPATVSANLTGASEDKVGGWSVFGPGTGNINKNPNDWNWKMGLTFNSQGKSVSRITLIHNTKGEIWSTGYSRYLLDGTDLYGYNEHPYPLVLTTEKVGTGSGLWYQINTAYDQTLYIGGSNTSLDIANVFSLYGQPESTTFTGGKLVVEFTDGTSVTTIIPASNITQAPLPVQVSLNALAVPVNSSITSGDNVLARWKLTAVGGSSTISKEDITYSNSGVKVKDLRLHSFSDSNFSVPAKGLTNPLISTQIPPVGDGKSLINFVFSPLVIDVNSSTYLELRGTIDNSSAGGSPCLLYFVRDSGTSALNWTKTGNCSPILPPPPVMTDAEIVKSIALMIQGKLCASACDTTFDFTGEGSVLVNDVIFVMNSATIPDESFEKMYRKMQTAVAERFNLNTGATKFIAEFDINKNGTIEQSDWDRISKALIGTRVYPAITQPSIILNSPRQGDVINITGKLGGGSLTFTWETKNWPNDKYLKFELVKSDGTVIPIVAAPMPPYYGTYIIGINGDISGSYRARVYAIKDGPLSATEEAWSGYFTIAIPPLTDAEIITSLAGVIRSRQCSSVTISSCDSNFDLDNSGLVNVTDVAIISSALTISDSQFDTVYKKMMLAVTERLGLKTGDVKFIVEFDIDKNGIIEQSDWDKISKALIGTRVYTPPVATKTLQISQMANALQAAKEALEQILKSLGQ